MPRIIQFYEWNVKLNDFLYYMIYTHTLQAIKLIMTPSSMNEVSPDLLHHFTFQMPTL